MVAEATKKMTNHRREDTSDRLSRDNVEEPRAGASAPHEVRGPIQIAMVPEHRNLL